MVMHAAGLAHLDLKPGNIIMAEHARSKLADFGAACAIHPRTGCLAVSGVARDEQVDSLCTTMEHTLAGGVKVSELASAGAALDDSERAVAAAAVAAVQARVLPARSCPGELLATVDELAPSGAPSGSLESRAPGVLRQTSVVEKVAPSVTFRSSSCSGENAAAMPIVRGRTQSIMAAYTRQPAYSLREVPMVRDLDRIWRQVACCLHPRSANTWRPCPCRAPCHSLLAVHLRIQLTRAFERVRSAQGGRVGGGVHPVRAVHGRTLHSGAHGARALRRHGAVLRRRLAAAAVASAHVVLAAAAGRHDGQGSRPAAAARGAPRV